MKARRCCPGCFRLTTFARLGQHLAFIHYDTKINGCPTAEADFQRKFKVSRPAVHDTILALERGGWITRAPGKPRSIRLKLRRNQISDLE